MSKTTQISIYVILGLIILALLGVCAWYIQESKRAEANVTALQNGMDSLQLKNGYLVTFAQALEVQNGKLSKEIEDKDGHIKEIEKKLGRLSSYTKIETVYKLDSIVLRDTIRIIDGLPCTGFGYQDEWLKFDCIQCKDDVLLDQLRLTTPLEVGVTTDNKVTVTSPCPYLSISKINATARAEKKKYWNFGVQVGFGGGYDVLHKQVFVGPYLGVGLAFGLDF